MGEVRVGDRVPVESLIVSAAGGEIDEVGGDDSRGVVEQRLTDHIS